MPSKMTSPAIPLLLRAFHPYLDRGMSQIVTSPDVGRQWMTPTLLTQFNDFT
jgi:hypothetical protein